MSSGSDSGSRSSTSSIEIPLDVLQDSARDLIAQIRAVQRDLDVEEGRLEEAEREAKEHGNKFFQPMEGWRTTYDGFAAYMHRRVENFRAVKKNLEAQLERVRHQITHGYVARPPREETPDKYRDEMRTRYWRPQRMQQKYSRKRY